MRAAIAVAVLLVAGCARLPAVDDGLSAGERAEALRSTESWEMRGRLAVDTGERAFQARFGWVQTADALSLTVRGPLGAGSFRIAGDRDRLTVLSRGEERILDDPELELSMLFGWWLPVTSLPAWLLGLPDTRFPGDLKVGADGVPDGLEQRLWRVRYEAFQLADGLMIPRSMSLSHPPLSLRLTIDDWHRTSPTAALN